MEEERRDSFAATQLTRAQQKIATLEEFIRDRERQFHSAVVRLRLERGDSRHHRLRRVGRSHDVLLRMRSVSRDEPYEDFGMLLSSVYRICSTGRVGGAG